MINIKVHNLNIKYFAVLVLSVMPLFSILLAGYDDWIFPKYYMMDDWMYIGNALNYPDITVAHKISRLPFILYNNIVFNFFNAHLAPFISALFILCTCGILMFIAVLRYTKSISLAAIGCVFITVGPIFLQFARSFQYHTAFSPMFLLGTLCLIPTPGQKFSVSICFCAFLLLSIGIHSDPICLMWLVPLGLLYLNPVLSKGIHIISIFKNVLLIIIIFILSFFITTILLCCINKIVYGSWIFFQQGLDLLIKIVGSPEKADVWWKPICLFDIFSKQYIYLYPSIFGIVISSIYCARGIYKRDFVSRYTVVICGAFFIICISYLLSYLNKNHPLNYAYFILPLDIFAIFTSLACLEKCINYIQINKYGIAIFGILLCFSLLFLWQFCQIEINNKKIILCILLFVFLCSFCFYQKQRYISFLVYNLFILLLTFYPHSTIHNIGRKQIYNIMVDNFNELKHYMYSNGYKDRKLFRLGGFDSDRSSYPDYNAAHFSREFSLLGFSYLLPRIKGIGYTDLNQLIANPELLQSKDGEFLVFMTTDLSNKDKLVKFFGENNLKLEQKLFKKNKDSDFSHYMLIYAVENI